MIAKNFFYLFALFAVIGIQSVQSQDCEERQAQAEKLLRTVLRIDRVGFKPITTEEEFSEYCRRAKEGLVMYKAYGKCLSGIGKQIYTLLKTTATKALRNHCVINPKTSLEYLSCFQDQKLTAKYRKCLFRFGDALNFAGEMAEDEEIFSSLCCGFNSLSSCLDDTFQSNGACTDPKINLRSYSKTLFKGLFGSVADAFCSSYTPDVCKTKMARMDAYMLDNKDSAISSFSVVKNLIRLSEKLSA